MPTTKEKGHAPAQSYAENVEAVPLAKIELSKLNNRHPDNSKDAAALAKDIAQKGQLQAGVARKKGSKYELLIGSRRYHTLKTNGAITMDVVVRELNDREAMACIISENRRRKDLTVIEKCRGVEQMLEQCNGDIEMTAKLLDISKLEAHKCIQVSNLSEKWKTTINAGKSWLSRLRLAHYQEVARFNHKTQDQIFKKAETYVRELKQPGDATNNLNWLSFLIQDITNTLNNAPWDTADETLVPSAGSCNTCKHRQSSEEDLFGDIDGKGRCTDEKCFATKSVAYIQLKIRKVEEEHGAIPQLITSAPGGSYNSHDDFERLKKADTKKIPGKLAKMEVNPSWRFGKGKKGGKGSVPMIRTDRGHVGEVVWVKDESYQATKPKKASKAETKKGSSSTPTLKALETDFRERQQRHKNKIAAKTIAAFLEVLQTYDEKKCKDMVEEINILALVRAFGMPYKHNFRGSNHSVTKNRGSWSVYDETERMNSVDASAAIASSIIREILPNRLAYNTQANAGEAAQEAKRIADLLMIDFDAMLEETRQENGEPRNWKRIRAEIAEAKKKGPKGPAKKKKTSK